MPGPRRSGRIGAFALRQGAHIWIFFDEAIPAPLARKLGAHVLTETMSATGCWPLDFYDRFFPNQDTPSAWRLRQSDALPLKSAA